MTVAQTSSTPLPDTNFSYRTGTLYPLVLYFSLQPPYIFGVSSHTALVLCFAWQVAGAGALLHLHLVGDHLEQVMR